MDSDSLEPTLPRARFGTVFCLLVLAVVCRCPWEPGLVSFYLYQARGILGRALCLGGEACVLHVAEQATCGPDQPKLPIQADPGQKHRDRNSLLWVSSGALAMVQTRKLRPERVVTYPSSHSKVSRACTWAVAARSQDVLPDHFTCLDCAWISFLFEVSEAT